MNRIAIATLLLATLAVSAADEKLASGPAVGKALPNTFEPTNVTGSDAG